MSFFKSLRLNNKIDSFYVLLKDEYTVADFPTRIPLTVMKSELFDIEYIGGQNRALIVVCKESLLHSWFVSYLIESYSFIPLLARITPSLLTKTCNAVNDNTELSVTVKFFPDVALSHDSFDSLSKSVNSLSSNREMSISSLNQSFLAPSSLIQILHSQYHQSNELSIEPHSLSIQFDSKSSSIVSLKGNGNNLLCYFSSLLHMKGVKSIQPTPLFKLHSINDEPSGSDDCLYCLCLGRLNEYMRQYVVDGQYSEGSEQQKLLDKHNLHILYYDYEWIFLH